MKNISAITLLFFFLAAAGNAAGGFSPLAGETASVSAPQPSQARPTPSKKASALCRKAQEQFEQGEASSQPQARAEHFRRAENFALQAIDIAPQNDEGYKWLAIALGAQAEDTAPKTQIALSRQVKRNIEKALRLDPDDDISLLVLSRWHYKVASLGGWTKLLVKLIYGGLPEASFEQAETLLLKAIAHKDRIAHRYSLAKVYHRMGRQNDAIDQLRLVLALPVTFAGEAEDLEKARRKLDRWQ